jgi:putative acetyltransferase
MSVAVRSETPADVAAIRAVLLSAFPTAQEADLVDALRADGDLVLSLVAIRDGKVAGHAAFSRMSVESGEGIFPALALAPVAVSPDCQHSGVGAALIEYGLQQLTARREGLIFVVGAPDYYRRFGFDSALASAFLSPYAGLHSMLKRLLDHAPTSGSLHYASAFSKLS